MVRITILNQFYRPDISPTAHLSASLAEHRAALGDQVTVVTSLGGYVGQGAGAKAEQAGPVRVHRVWTPQLGKGNVLKRCIDYGVFYFGALWRMVTLPGQDVVVSMTTPPFIALAGAAHKLLHPRSKLILWSMDCYPEAAERTGVLREGGLASRVMRVLNRFLFRRLAHVVVLDSAMDALLMDQYAPKDGRLKSTVIPNWEDASFFPADAAYPEWSGVAQHGLGDRFIVLYLGNTGYGHQFETVIEAAALLENTKATFVFVGGGSRWESIRELAQSRGLSNVILHGYVDKSETPAVMASASCALITLRDEVVGVMSPSKLHSNLAMGLPIIYVGPTESNVDDAVRQFDCGVSLRHGDAAGLAAFVRGLMDDEARRQTMSDRARSAFDEAYCDTVTLKQFDGLLEAVCSTE